MLDFIFDKCIVVEINWIFHHCLLNHLMFCLILCRFVLCRIRSSIPESWICIHLQLCYCWRVLRICYWLEFIFRICYWWVYFQLLVARRYKVHVLISCTHNLLFCQLSNTFFKENFHHCRAASTVSIGWRPPLQQVMNY